MARTNRSRNARPAMSRTDWTIAVAIAVPAALMVAAAVLIRFFG